MMKVTIIKDDGAVYKDGVSFSNLVLDTIPDDVHALQWDNNTGHIEYANNLKPVESINALPDWVNDALTAWQTAYNNEQAAILAAKEALKVLKAKQAAADIT